jgi:uncharacterized protein (DUF2147 family)
MFRTAIAIALGLSSVAAMAQMTPVGLWQTISDKDGKVASEVRIAETAGAVNGKIEKVLTATAKPDDKCIACKDDRKDQPIVGLEFLRGLKKTDGKDVWEGGTVVDPESGTVYKARITMIEGGKKLEMRGFVGAPLFGRTQTWIRVQ